MGIQHRYLSLMILVLLSQIGEVKTEAIGTLMNSAEKAGLA